MTEEWADTWLSSYTTIVRVRSIQLSDQLTMVIKSTMQSRVNNSDGLDEWYRMSAMSTHSNLK